MRRSHEELVRTADQAEAEAATEGPAAQLRARILAQYGWAQAHPGLYNVLHESKVNRSPGVAFKEVLAERTTVAIQRCIDAGVAPPADPGTVAFDLRTASAAYLYSTRFRDEMWLPAAHGTRDEIPVAPRGEAGRMSGWTIKNPTSAPELFRVLSPLSDR